MNVTTYALRVEFIEDVLGSIPLNEEVYSDFIGTKHPDGDAAAKAELLTVEETITKGKTGFHRDENGTPLIYDYVMRGYFKDACGKCREHPDSGSAKLKAYKNKIGAHLFVKERRIPIHAAGAQYVLERPLRAETMQGPRVALAASDALPAGTWFECTLEVLAPQIITEELLNEWLEFGHYSGFGQWRSGGYGRFTYTLRKVE